jgi:hypothetical protein
MPINKPLTWAGDGTVKYRTNNYYEPLLYFFHLEKRHGMRSHPIITVFFHYFAKSQILTFKCQSWIISLILEKRSHDRRVHKRFRQYAHRSDGHGYISKKDHIKNALTKTKNPPQKIQKWPHGFPPKKYKKDHKNENKALIVIFGGFLKKQEAIFVFFFGGLGIFGFS